MKKAVGILLVLIILCLAACALASVALTYENFPDSEFRKYLSRQKFDWNEDGILSDSEIEDICDFDVGGLQICELTGIEHLTSIWRLGCRFNYLSELDISRNTGLTALECYGNSGLTRLDVSNCPALVRLVKENPRKTEMVGNTLYDVWFASSTNYLHVPETATVIAGDYISRPIVRLDGTFFPDSAFRAFVSQYDTDGNGELSDGELAAVTEMDCSGREIDRLTGIEHFYKLKKLVCGSNLLEGINVSKNPALTILDCSDNADAYSIKLNAGLKKLYCQECDIWKLDVSMCAGLEVLHCYGNRITELDVSRCPVLCGYMKDNERVTDTDGHDRFGKNFVFAPDVTVTGDFVSEPLPEPTGAPSEEPTAEPTAEPTDAPTAEPGTDPTPAPAPTTATVGALKYSLKGSAATVTGPKSKSAKKLTIPATIKVEGKTYKVTAIKTVAFRGLKKLTAVVIGKNVKTIGAKAFYKCAKLKTITIKTTKLTTKTVGANAFKGVYKKATVKVPAKKLKAYKTLLVKKGLPKTAKVKK